MEDDSDYPGLLLVSEFGGEIEARSKLYKTAFLYREKEYEKEDWPFTLNEWGPTEPGVAKRFDEWEKVDILDIIEEDPPYIFKLTEKGLRFIEGIKEGKLMLDDAFEGRLSKIKKLAYEKKDKSASEIIEEEDAIQEAKKKPYQSDV